MAKETKYFMVGTEDEVQPGDVVEVVLTKKNKQGNRKLHKREYCDVTYTTLPYLINLGILEERAVEVEDEEENNDLLNFSEDEGKEIIRFLENYDNFREVVSEDIEELDGKVENLLKDVANHSGYLMTVFEEISKLKRAVKKLNNRKR